MTDTPSLLLHRIDPARNMARFYALSIEPSLFDEIALLRRWGRIGGRGQQIIELHRDHSDALRAFNYYAQQKQRRGYSETAGTGNGSRPTCPEGRPLTG